MENNNHQDWLNNGPWYNTYISSKLRRRRFEDFITQTRTYRYNLMCSLVVHDKLEIDYKKDESSIGDREIPDNATTKTLEALGFTISFIYIWLKFFCENFNAIYDAVSMLCNICSCKYPKLLKYHLLPNKKSKNL